MGAKADKFFDNFAPEETVMSSDALQNHDYSEHFLFTVKWPKFV